MNHQFFEKILCILIFSIRRIVKCELRIPNCICQIVQLTQVQIVMPNVLWKYSWDLRNNVHAHGRWTDLEQAVKAALILTVVGCRHFSKSVLINMFLCWTWANFKGLDVIVWHLHFSPQETSSWNYFPYVSGLFKRKANINELRKY